MQHHDIPLKRTVAGLAALVLCLVTAPAARADPVVYEKTLRATGWVIVPQNETRSESGTCCLVDRERKLVLTNCHVVGDKSDVVVYFPVYDKGEVVLESSYYRKHAAGLRGKVLARDARRDLALVELSAVPAGVAVLPAALRSPRAGEIVHSVGNSSLGPNLDGGTLWRYTQGTVRQVAVKQIRLKDFTIAARVIESQAPINAGDSGGPLVNGRGELVGIVSSFSPDSRLVSWAIDGREVKAFLKEALKTPTHAATPAADVPGKRVGNPLPNGEVRAPSVLGGWAVTLTSKASKDISGTATFHDEGKFALRVLAAGKPNTFQGQFTYANGILMLVSETINEGVRPTWATGDRFTFTSAGVRFVFDRR